MRRTIDGHGSVRRSQNSGELLPLTESQPRDVTITNHTGICTQGNVIGKCHYCMIQLPTEFSVTRCDAWNDKNGYSQFAFISESTIPTRTASIRMLTDPVRPVHSVQ
jgi:hypothetical protein